MNELQKIVNARIRTKNPMNVFFGAKRNELKTNETNLKGHQNEFITYQ